MAHILIVEDDKRLSNLIAGFLQSQNFEVTQVYSGDDGVFKILQKRPDLVVLDIMLPNMDGLQVCRTVRQYYQGAILMLTAKGDDDTQITGLADGADDYVSKPIVHIPFYSPGHSRVIRQVIPFLFARPFHSYSPMTIA